MKLEHHPIANIFPMMREEEFLPFKEGMKKFGYNPKKPIVIFEGKILDGRNRNKSASELGMDVPSIEFIPNGKTPLDFVIEENLKRRHMTTGQLAASSLELYDALRDQYMKRDAKNLPTEFKGGCNMSRAKHTAKMFGVGRTAVTTCLMMRKYNPEILARVKTGELTLSNAYKLMPKVRSMKQNEASEAAISKEVLKEFKTPFEMPLVFDSYEKFMGQHRLALNDAGYMMQAVMVRHKVYVQIVKEGQNFKPWGNCRSEYQYKIAVVGAMKDFKI